MSSIHQSNRISGSYVQSPKKVLAVIALTIAGIAVAFFVVVAQVMNFKFECSFQLPDKQTEIIFNDWRKSKQFPDEAIAEVIIVGPSVTVRHELPRGADMRANWDVYLPNKLANFEQPVVLWNKLSHKVAVLSKSSNDGFRGKFENGTVKLFPVKDCFEWEPSTITRVGSPPSVTMCGEIMVLEINTEDFRQMKRIGKICLGKSSVIFQQAK